MTEKYSHTLLLKGNEFQMEQVLRIVADHRPCDPFDFLRVLDVWDNGLLFITSNLDTGEVIAPAVSLKCKHIEVELHTAGDLFDPCYVQSVYYNGTLTSRKFYYPCAFKIQIPACLGYSGNIYESASFVPETECVDREDTSAIANMILKMAIAEAPNKAWAQLLSNDGDALDAALEAAAASLVRVYDPDLYPDYHTSDNCSFDPCISNVTASDTDDIEDNSDFPF